MAAQTRVDFGGIRRPPGTLDATALDPYRGPLTQRSAAHLLRRAGFGGSPDDVARYASMSIDAAVESLVRFPSTASLPAPDDVYNPIALLEQYGGPRGYRAMSMEDRRALGKEIRGNEFQSMIALRIWWLNRMLTTPAPLQEKMALRFSGHFVSTPIQKDVSPSMIYNQNQLFRRYALGNVRELTREVSKDAAMLCYLDNRKNVKGNPNENYARELMELFTLGLNQYTENDIRESARAWTGWRFNNFTEEVHFEERFHDEGVKTFLGQTGNFTGDDVVNIIFEQPQAARFFGAWLLSTFVYDDPEPELVDAVAAQLRKHDFELAPVVSKILRSNVFYSDRAYRALVKSPVEFVVGTYKTLGLASIDARALPQLQQMGQVLFYPPNVAGWPGGENWITSVTMLARQNFLVRTINSQTIAQSSWLHSVPMKAQAATQQLISAILQGDAAPASAFQVEGFLGGSGTSALAALSPENYDQRVSGAAYLALAMPAYQLS